MSIETLLARALALSTQAHQGQVDRMGMPYLFHVMRVAAALPNPEDKVVALLHDVLEDTPTTAADLLAHGFPPHLVEAVQALTKDEAEDYDLYLNRVKANPQAVRVKLADLRDNLTLTRLTEVTPADLPRLNRYLKAYHTLTALAPHA